MVSVVIPTYNEEIALPLTLSNLLGQLGTYEVIGVDGGSEDRTREIFNTTPRVQLVTTTKGRASQMNAGAAHAKGEWLLFLHADTRLPNGALSRLNVMEANPAIQAGGFYHQFSGDDWRLRLVSQLDNLRCRTSRTIYGDQAMFVRRSLFEQLDGFPDLPYLEDAAFSKKLNRVTTPLLLSPPIVTDARKFLKVGIWRSFLRVVLIMLHMNFRLPYSPRAFFQDIR